MIPTKKIILALIILGLISAAGVTIIWFLSEQKRMYSVGMAVEFNDHAAAAWISYEKGWFENIGLNLTTFESYATGIALAAAIARGDIQVAWLCVGPAIVSYKRGINLKIVAMTHEYGYAIVVNKSIIKSVYDLEGKKIGCVREGSMADLLLNKVIEKYNLNNITILRMKPMDQINAIREHQVDAIAVPEHYVAIAKSFGFDILIKSQDIWPYMPGSALVVKQELIDKYPEAVERLVNLTVFATDWLKEHQDEAAQILATKLETTKDVILDSMSRINYTNQINETTIQELIDFMAELGYIEKFNASEIIDTSFLEKVTSSSKSMSLPGININPGDYQWSISLQLAEVDRLDIFKISTTKM
ncbi:MAG: ABC transporter substrate-binding protein [Candidatus Odinarchaeota archaeon]|nr:ABC transporter substrate-binding protein [Candidatus Odinarchaeota archaeon]